MSSNSSRDFYHNPQGRTVPQNLPPLRSVLGDQLYLPLNRSGYASPYELGEISKAFPPPSGGIQDYHISPRPSPSMRKPFAESRGPHSEAPQSQLSYTYSHSSTSEAGQCFRSVPPTYDESRHASSSSRRGSYMSAASISTSRGSDRSAYKKYACSWEGCDKRFERQAALDTHMNIHLEQKPFTCPVPYCGKAFNVRSNMRRHLLTHNGYPSGDGGGNAKEEGDSRDVDSHHVSGCSYNSSRGHQGDIRPSSFSGKNSFSPYYYSSSGRV